MKKINTLLSFLIAFTFATVSFGQENPDDDALTRTTPVISHSGGNSGGSPQNNVQIKWGIVKVKGNSITLKLTKSIECAMLQSITAKTDQGVSLDISYNPNDLRGLKVGVQKSITIKLSGDYVDKKVSIGLSWDLQGCNETTLGVNTKTNQSQMKALAAPNQQSTSNQPPNPTGGKYASSDGINVILKAEVGTKAAAPTNTKAVERKKDWQGLANNR